MPHVDDKARFYTGVGVRGVQKVRSRSYRCAKIVGRTFRIKSFGTSMNSTSIRARRQGGDLTGGGDSGGPVFYRNTALGTMSAKYGQDMIYMAINYVDSDPIGVAKVQTR